MELRKMPKKKKHKQQVETPNVSKAAKRYLENNLVGNYGLYTFGKCPSCKKGNTQLIADADNVPIISFIENLYRVNSFDYITCENCETKYLPKLVQLRNSDTQEVILNDPLKNLQKKMEHTFESDPSESVLKNIIEHNEFFNTFIEACLEYFDEIIKELTKDEILQAIKIVRPDAILPSSMALLRKYINNYVIEKEQRIQFLQATSQSFLVEFFTRNPIGGWVNKTIINKFGFHRLFIALAYVPLPPEVEVFRYRALKELQVNNSKLFEHLSVEFPYMNVMFSVMNEQEFWSKKANKLEQENEQLKAHVRETEDKLGTAYGEIEKLKQESKQKSDRSSEDVQKIKELKGFINELKDELERLYSFVPIEEVSEETQEEVKVVEGEKEVNIQPEALSMLQDKRVAIIGGVRTREQKSKFEDITILTHDGRKLDPTFYQTIQIADIIILITTYCSHATMWLTKASAIANDKIILFEKNVNVSLLLERANEFLMKKTQQHIKN